MEDQVPENKKKDRAARLASLGKEIQDRLLSDYIARHGENDPVSVLVEKTSGGIANGHTEHFIECDIPASEDLTGKVVKVALEKRNGNVLMGRLVR